LPRGGSISGRATLLPSLTATPSGVAPSPPHRRHPAARPRPWAGGASKGGHRLGACLHPSRLALRARTSG
jgi:hypothetical protein